MCFSSTVTYSKTACTPRAQVSKHCPTCKTRGSMRTKSLLSVLLPSAFPAGSAVPGTCKGHANTCWKKGTQFRTQVCLCLLSLILRTQTQKDSKALLSGNVHPL